METGQSSTGYTWVEVAGGVTSRHHTWLLESVGPRGMMMPDEIVPHNVAWAWHKPRDSEPRVYFKDASRAMLFKLAWT
jgi:hypothetical protein